jgi:hypothetical protein
MKYITTATDKLEGWGGTDFLNNVMIAQRPWIFHCNSATKKTGCSEDKVSISVVKAKNVMPQSEDFLYIKCILHNKYLPGGQIWSTATIPL